MSEEEKKEIEQQQEIKNEKQENVHVHHGMLSSCLKNKIMKFTGK